MAMVYRHKVRFAFDNRSESGYNTDTPLDELAYSDLIADILNKAKANGEMAVLGSVGLDPEKVVSYYVNQLTQWEGQ